MTPSEDRAPDVGGAPRRTSPRTIFVGAAEIVPAIGGVLAVAVLSSTGNQQSGSPGFFQSIGFVLLLCAFVVVRFVGSAAGWWFRTYVVGDTELVIDEGIVSRKRRVVPYNRVQEVDTHQNLVSQLFGVGALRVSTAIASGSENVTLRFLDMPDAEGLRSYVLRRRQELQQRSPAGEVASPEPPEGTPPEGTPSADPTVAERIVISLTPGRLALASVTHSSLLLGAMFGLVIGLYAGAGIAAASATLQLAALLGGGILAAIAVGLAAGVIVVIRHLVERYGFTVAVVGDDLHLRFGLLEVRKLTVPRRRVQQVTIVDNPIRRAMGLASLELRTASARGHGSEAFEIPLIDRATVDDLLADLMGTDSWRAPAVDRRPPVARGRAIRRRVLASAVLALPIVVLLFPFGAAALLLALLGVPWGIVAHRRAGHGLSATLVRVSHGVFVNRTDLVPLARVQSARTHASPFQRRATVTTFLVDVAGRADAPHLYDMDDPTASDLMRRLPRQALVAPTPA